MSIAFAEAFSSFLSEYYGRMQVWPDASSNSTAPEYLCVHSFVWTFLVPRLLFVFGYLAVFACVFCLNAPDLEYVVSRVRHWAAKSMIGLACERMRCHPHIGPGKK